MLREWEQIERTNDYNAWLIGGVLFCGPPAFGLGYLFARRGQLRDLRASVAGLMLGLFLAALLMLWLRNTGIPYAFSAFIGAVFGTHYGAQANKYRGRRSRARAARRQREAEERKKS